MYFSVVLYVMYCFFFKQKTAYERRIRDWSSDVCSSDLAEELLRQDARGLCWQALRPPVVYGPGDRATLPLFRQFARGLVLRPSGGGRFSMLYVEDLAAAVAALLDQGGPASGEIGRAHV